MPSTSVAAARGARRRYRKKYGHPSKTFAVAKPTKTPKGSKK